MDLPLGSLYWRMICMPVAQMDTAKDGMSFQSLEKICKNGMVSCTSQIIVDHRRCRAKNFHTTLVEIRNQLGAKAAHSQANLHIDM